MTAGGESEQPLSQYHATAGDKREAIGVFSPGRGFQPHLNLGFVGKGCASNRISTRKRRTKSNSASSLAYASGYYVVFRQSVAEA
jgi:hypothetical protein